ncbi:MAG: SDR family NAD(P)-dependent oxidoreductase [Oscillospiraceae bacterium]
MERLKNKVAIVTGGGKGIGLGVATAYAKEGADLVITGRTLSTLQNTGERLSKEYGVNVLPIVADGSEEEEVIKAIEQTIDKYHKIDVLVNNAQVAVSGVPFVKQSTSDFCLAVNTGLFATFNYMKYAFPYLKESKGKVINFASGAGISGNPGQGSYAAAKEGIRGLSRVAATEWGEFGINVNVVCPLAMTPGLAKWKEEYPEAYDRNIKGIPLGRFGDPTDDIGKVCLFLATDDSSYVTGETISVQGGSGLRA